LDFQPGQFRIFYFYLSIMLPERWQQIKSILEATLEQSPPARSVYLERLCGADETLRREVESLLAFENSGAETDVFEKNCFCSVSEIEERESNGFVGRQIGKYRIERELGAGGMGVVFLAGRNDGEFAQQVAVKFLRQSFYSQSTLKRFVAERQMLARLNHRFIAQLIDGGTTEDGTPFLVMEYVVGTPITVYADRENLSLEARINLFRKVCEAVSFAHRNLIVHRDLKPDNILVNADGTPKLLDFGIAKLLTDSEVKVTVTRSQAFTPEYASPEQIMGQAITTASDVYVLGIILYELLSGKRPFYLADTDDHAEVRRILDRTEPIVPSRAGTNAGKKRKGAEEKRATRNGQNDDGKHSSDYKQKTSPQSSIPNPKFLRGDLDNIILKALKNEPERRYESVERFSEDLRRYQVGLPVTARADTFLYRAGKFVGRNRLAVVAVNLILLSLLAGMFAALYQSRRAERERLRAETKAENLRKISKSLVFDIHDAIRNLPGSLTAREMLLERAVEQLDELATEAADQPGLQEELAQAFFNVGEMQQAIGNVAAAEESHKRAVALYEKLERENPNQPSYRRGLASGFDFLANIAYLRGEADKSARFYAQSVAIFERLAAENPNDDKSLEDLWNTYGNYAISLNRAGRFSEALAIGDKALKLAERLNQTENPNPAKRQRLILSKGLLGATYNLIGDYGQAIERLEPVIAESEKLHGEFPEDTRFQYDLWAFKRRLGIAYGKSGRFSDARKTLEKSLLHIENLMHGSPKDAGYKRNTSITLLALAEVFLNAQKSADAMPLLIRARRISENLLANDPNNGETVADLALIYGALTTAAAQDQKITESFNYLEKSLELFTRSPGKNPENVLLKRDYAETLERTAKAFAGAANGRGDERAKGLAERANFLVAKSRELRQ